MSPSTNASAARSPSITCWSMWTKKSSSSSGISCAPAARVIPNAKLACRHPGTGAPRAASVLARRQYMTATTASGRSAVKAVIAPY